MRLLMARKHQQLERMERQKYVLKAGPEDTDPFKTRNAPESDASIEQSIERCLQETRELCTRDVQMIPSPMEPEDQEEEVSFPIPEESSESTDTAPQASGTIRNGCRHV
jgi:hypothetical protein